MLFEEFFLFLILDFVLLEELIKEVVRVRFVFDFILRRPFHKIRIDPESVGWSYDSWEGEEGLMNVKERS